MKIFRWLLGPAVRRLDRRYVRRRDLARLRARVEALSPKVAAHGGASEAFAPHGAPRAEPSDTRVAVLEAELSLLQHELSTLAREVSRLRRGDQVRA